MDNEADWAAQGLFSPSKARLVQTQANEWALIDAWLAKKYSSGRVPSFERNDDTLQALLALVRANEAADDHRLAVQKVQRAALQSLSKPRSALADELTSAILQSIGSDASKLRSSAEAAVCLDVSTRDGSGSILTGIVRLQNELFEAKQQEHIWQGHIDKLMVEKAHLALLIEELDSENLQPSTISGEETADWQKNSKHLRAKIAEYDERLAASKPSGRMQDVLRELGEVSRSSRQYQLRLSQLKDQIAACESLLEQSKGTA